MQTLETMAILARIGSREKCCTDLVASLIGDRFHTADCVSFIDDFLRNVFVYRDEREEVLRDVPYMVNDLETLGHMEGDCDDMTIMGCAMLRNAGIACRMTAIQSMNDLEFDHVFSEARVGTEWIPVDPTVTPQTKRYLVFGYMSEAV